MTMTLIHLNFNITIFLTLFYILSSQYQYHRTHRVICKRKKICNGNLMCAYVCEKGSVSVDSWVTQSLAYQKKIGFKDQLVYLQFPSTHNSAINEADGFGIEKYFISALQGGTNLDQGDDVGEGVCQYLTITDQLRMGIRHIEIDIWWGPINEDIEVCHSPIPLYPVGNISRTAEADNITLIWEPKYMSCIGTKRTFTAVLEEIRDWMILPENSDEIVILFLDTKFYLSPEQVSKGNGEIINIFGDSNIWKYTDGNPLTHTQQELLTTGKRLIIEANRDSWLSPSVGSAVVFYPTLWTHQFSSDSFTEFPGCTIEGDSHWYGSQWVRALDGSFIEAASRCGVQFVSGDYTNPDDMKLYIWSWDQGEPQLKTGCVAMLPNGRWATLSCDLSFPYACLGDQRDENNHPVWNVNLDIVGSWDSNSCSSGFSFQAPHDGYSNGLLLNAGPGQTVWLNAYNPLNI